MKHNFIYYLTVLKECHPSYLDALASQNGSGNINALKSSPQMQFKITDSQMLLFGEDRQHLYIKKDKLYDEWLFLSSLWFPWIDFEALYKYLKPTRTEKMKKELEEVTVCYSGNCKWRQKQDLYILGGKFRKEHVNSLFSQNNNRWLLPGAWR